MAASSSTYTPMKTTATALHHYQGLNCPGERHGGGIGLVRCCDVVQRIKDFEAGRGEVAFDRRPAGAAFGVGLGAVFAGEEPAGEHLVREDRHTVPFGGIGQFLLVVPGNEGVLRLKGHRLGETVLLRDAEPLVDGLRGEVGQRDGTYLALGDEPVEGRSEER